MALKARGASGSFRDSLSLRNSTRPTAQSLQFPNLSSYLAKPVGTRMSRKVGKRCSEFGAGYRQLEPCVSWMKRPSVQGRIHSVFEVPVPSAERIKNSEHKRLTRNRPRLGHLFTHLELPDVLGKQSRQFARLFIVGGGIRPGLAGIEVVGVHAGNGGGNGEIHDVERFGLAAFQHAALNR